MIIELPCGLLKDGVVYDMVKVNELRGKQQNYLVDAELTTNNFGHVPKLLSDLLSDFQTKEGMPANIVPSEAIWQIPSEDLEVLLIKIREATYGPNFAMPSICLHCGKQQLKKIELNKLEIKKLANKAVRTKKLTLPKSGKEAEVKLLYLKDLFELYKDVQDKKHELFTSTTFRSLKNLGGKSPITADDLDDLPVTDIQLIVEEYMNLRGSIDLMITHTCDSCGKEFQNPLGVMDPLFFVQSQTPSI